MNVLDMPYWGALYPNWKNELVATILVDQPMKSFTLEECIAQGGNEEFYNYVPVKSSVYHPIEDLILMDEL